MREPTRTAAPAGVHSLSPHLVCAGAADAIEFYRKAFGAVEMVRLPGKDGELMHACVSINGSSVMLVDESPQFGVLGPKALKGTPESGVCRPGRRGARARSRGVALERKVAV